jgi:hypothetical protein
VRRGFAPPKVTSQPLDKSARGSDADDMPSPARIAIPPRTAIVAPIRLPTELAAIREAADRMAARGVPAHVTVLYPFLSAAELDSTVRDQVLEVAAHSEVFVASFDRAERHDEMVWIVPADQRPFLRLTAGYFDRWPDHPPYGGLYDQLVAHLTLLETSDREALDRAVDALEGALPFDVAVTELELIEEDEQGVWHRRWSLPLRS